MTMHQYSEEQRREYLSLMEQVGSAWLEVFQDNTEFYSTNYWDLLTALWRQPGPMRKTDALRSFKVIKSAHTAGKYLEEALKQGLVIEKDNPRDARSKLVELTPAMRRRLDRFFDKAISEVRRTSHRIEGNEENAGAP